MVSDPRRNPLSITVFWIFALLGVAALGTGLLRERAALDAATRAHLSELHVSLALTAALFFGAHLLLGAVLFVTIDGGGPRDRRRAAAFWLRQTIYLSFAVAIAAGALSVACRGEQIFFWDYPLPFWDAGNRAAADLLQSAHGSAAYVFAGVLVIYAGFVIFDRLSPPAAATGKALDTSAPQNFAMMIADGLAQSFRFFGGAAFWIQLFIGVVSGLLLAFSYVGHTVSPGATIFSEGIYWAASSLALLLLSSLFCFRYMSAAVSIRSRPERYLAHDRRLAFWFVAVGGFVNFLGALDSFVGVGMSVALLVGKTVSQPPGIAITDPNKIIRALDIFTLLVNFNLLFAHFIGVGVAAWLSISGLRARHQYLIAKGMEE